jgi:ribose 1,5-bisphosphate isomerase
VEAAASDIEAMRIRGAGAIARHAVDALGAMPVEADLEAAAARLLATRPTAVSLRNGIDFIRKRAHAAGPSPADRHDALRRAALEFHERTHASLAAIARYGGALIQADKTYLTHCNSQAAVAVFRGGVERGQRFRVVATETRPFRQGLLTVRDLKEAGVGDVDLAVDSAAFTLLEQGPVAAVVVGADTIAANGDVVNKIGTAQVALAAHERGVPFYVAAETFKVDARAANGAQVPIEERDASEVVDPAELPPGVHVVNPVFDVTPSRWIAAVITELGVVKPKDVLALAREAWT